LAATVAVLLRATGALSLTTMVKVRVATLFDVSRTETRNVWLSTWVGWPEMTPAVLRFRPAGRLPV